MLGELWKKAEDIDLAKLANMEPIDLLNVCTAILVALGLLFGLVSLIALETANAGFGLFLSSILFLTYPALAHKTIHEWQTPLMLGK